MKSVQQDRARERGKPAASTTPLRQILVQPKLTVGEPNDAYEQEADAMAGHIMRMPDQNFVQRKCSHCEQEEKIQTKPLDSFIQRASSSSGGMRASEKTTSQINASRGGGNQLDKGTQSFMASRFGTDFSGVKIHTGADAIQMNRELNARAFTVGSDIYFNENQYQPGSDTGKHLLAHELTHTVQQGGAESRPHISAHAISAMPPNRIARFTDTGHHIIEEAALAGAGFTEEQIRQIERGNVKRDYSQLPRTLNLFLLCENDTFGGYHAEDHIDNYIWNKEKDGFEDRGIVGAKKTGMGSRYIPTGDPIKQIEENITGLMRHGATPAGLELLGNAFHAVEDFFAHSNFMELTQRDFRFGHDLLTGSNDEGAGQIATVNLLNKVSPPQQPMFPEGHIEGIKDGMPPLSHSKIAKDYPTDRLHKEARQLAALVVQDLSRDILDILNTKEPETRIELAKTRVFTKIRRYLRPPDIAKDPWWTKMVEDDNGAIDRLLRKAEMATPVTVNQCMLSPMTNLEATRFSPVRAFGAGNTAIGLARLALGITGITDLQLTDSLLGAVPSITIPFTLNGHRANLTVGGLLHLPYGAMNPGMGKERRAFPEGVGDYGKAPNDKPHSGIGFSISGEFE